jgi:hypothetical protein
MSVHPNPPSRLLTVRGQRSTATSCVVRIISWLRGNQSTVSLLLLWSCRVWTLDHFVSLMWVAVTKWLSVFIVAHCSLLNTHQQTLRGDG